MNKFNLKRYIGDIAVFLLLSAVLVCIFFAFTFKNGNNSTASVLYDGKEIASLKLSKDTELTLHGVTIEVKDGRARITASDCPDKTCTAMKGVDENGGSAVCIPNKIIIKSQSNTTETDAVAG